MNVLTKRWLPTILAAVVLMTMCFGGLGAAPVYGAESDSPALSVYLEGNGSNPVKTYSSDDLKALAQQEGNQVYTFSGYNRNPSFYTYDVSSCVTVEGILEDAGIPVQENQIVKFTASDGFSTELTGAQLLEDRYYYPNGKIGTENGNAAPQEAYTGAEKVPAVLDLAEEGTLRFGQVAPNEQNITAFVKAVAMGGTITVGGKSSNWGKLVSANKPNGSTVESGTTITFDIPQDCQKGKIYYTTDGSEPTDGSKIYNYSKYGDIDPPTLTKTGSYTIKTKVMGYGKEDGEVSTFHYTVKANTVSPTPVTDLAKPVISKVTPGKKSITIQWKKVAGANGYQVYRATSKKGTYKCIKTINKGSVVSYKNKKLKKGKKYYYKIKAYKKVENRTIYSAYSSPKYAKAK